MLVRPEQRSGVLVRGACVVAEWRIEWDGVRKSRFSGPRDEFRAFPVFPSPLPSREQPQLWRVFACGNRSKIPCE